MHRWLIPETRVRFPVAAHLLTPLNLPVSSLAPDSTSNPVTIIIDVDTQFLHVTWWFLWNDKR